jgi:hypothetical protein
VIGVQKGARMNDLKENRRRRVAWRPGRMGTLALVAIAIALTGCSTGSTGSSDASASSASAPSSVAPSGNQPATMARSAPVRVRIPSIAVDSGLMDLGLRPDGTLEVPPAGFPAGWFTGAPTPGELGPAIIAGHVDWGGQPGVFYRLRDLKVGDEVTVGRKDGSTALFRVTAVERFSKQDFPTDRVYGAIDYAGLRLITCGGAFDTRARSYVDNIIAFGELVGSTPA